MNIFSKSKLRNTNLLDLTPIRKYEHRLRDDGTAEILLPRFKNKVMEKLFLPRKKSPYFILHLDDIGTATWLEIDGFTKVQGICDKLIQKYGEKVTPAEERAGKFITTLYHHGYLDFKELKKENK